MFFPWVWKFPSTVMGSSCSLWTLKRGDVLTCWHQYPVPLAFRLVTWIYLVWHTFLSLYLLWANCHRPGNLMTLTWWTYQDSSHQWGSVWSSQQVSSFNHYFVTSSSTNSRIPSLLLSIKWITFDLSRGDEESTLRSVEKWVIRIICSPLMYFKARLLLKINSSAA